MVNGVGGFASFIGVERGGCVCRPRRVSTPRLTEWALHTCLGATHLGYTLVWALQTFLTGPLHTFLATHISV